MPTSTATGIDPKTAIPVVEAAAAAGIPVRSINRLINDADLPKSVCGKSGKRRAIQAFAIPMACFGASEGTKLSLQERRKAMGVIGEFAKKNWDRLWNEPEHAQILRFESGCIIVLPGDLVRNTMAGLRKWIEALSRIVEDPDIRGGIPVVRGTRIGVHEAANALAADGMDNALEDYPSLSREDFEAAALYAKVHPKTGCRHGIPQPWRLVSKTAVRLPVAE